MTYSEVSPEPEMPHRRMRMAIALAVLLALSGCATYNPVTLFHRYEGGTIGTNPPPAPGLDQPEPNLASVPKKPKLLPATVQRTVRARLQAANAGQNALPAPGEKTTGVVSCGCVYPMRTPPPVLIGFERGRAVLSYADRLALRGLAARRDGATVTAMGFAGAPGEAGLRLAMLRATAIANALTLHGVPASEIRLAALAQGRGGAAQLVYPPPSSPQPGLKKSHQDKP